MLLSIVVIALVAITLTTVISLIVVNRRLSRVAIAAGIAMAAPKQKTSVFLDELLAQSRAASAGTGSKIHLHDVEVIGKKLLKKMGN